MAGGLDNGGHDDALWRGRRLAAGRSHAAVEGAGARTECIAALRAQGKALAAALAENADGDTDRDEAGEDSGDDDDDTHRRRGPGARALARGEGGLAGAVVELLRHALVHGDAVARAAVGAALFRGGGGKFIASMFIS